MSTVRLDELIVGSKLLVRSRRDWRNASVRAILDEKILLNVVSTSGRTYLLRRKRESEILLMGDIAILPTDKDEDWRHNFCKHDARW
jgi:hypothetical protein